MIRWRHWSIDMKDSPTAATALASKARTPFPGASAEYERARQALLAEERSSSGAT
jgi:hypothetical protein